MRVLLSEVNISEGKNQDIIEKTKNALLSVHGVKLIDLNSDTDHNRSVFTYIGGPEVVLEATKRLADTAIELIDMTKHHGSHPRMGAVDVVPFMPIKGVENDEAIKIAHEFGKYIGNKGIPVYYYEDAAHDPKRKSLVDIRKGQYEGLEEKLKNPKWKPDEGSVAFVPKTGAVIIGVRFPLIAFNVNLKTEDIEIAKRIAKSVRFLNGGFRYVRAIGLKLEDKGMVQVSMNLINYEKTPIYRVIETIRFEVSRFGVMIDSAELVGPVPLMALEEVIKYYLQAHDFSMNQIIETNMIG